MFTGIVQGVAKVAAITDRAGLRTFAIDFPEGFADGLAIGASVAHDGVCLTVTRLTGPQSAEFDVMQQSLAITTLGDFKVGDGINVERAARDGAEIGGHPISGHVDFTATLASIRQPENNYVLRIAVPEQGLRYIFPKGYVAVNGASLTIAEVNRAEGWFEIWLIPETLRMTTFGHKQAGDRLNVEIERGTQVVVDTINDTLERRLGPLLPALEAFLRERGGSLGDLAAPIDTPALDFRPGKGD
ncbi:riboflavin synthase subunit alpha [Derxia lacustris]|uniref:riboflavin synthase subunit alpha n=1 Tax=Derxia lacustris TaxID=764842 RepID=UPI000A16FD43|nr:riboflavin synthase subunit alpha [Derxia lacustris]